MDPAIIRAVIANIQQHKSCAEFITTLEAYKQNNPVGCTDHEYAILHNLVSAIEPINILEIGPGCGASTLAMLLGCSAKIQQVTIHPGSGRAAIPTKYHDRITTFYGSSDAFFAQNTKEYNFIFVDGDHEESAVTRDLNSSFNWLAPGGVIVAHDICHPGSRYIDLICSRVAEQKNRSYNAIYTDGNGVGVIY